MSAPCGPQTAQLANRLLASVFLVILLLGLGASVEVVAIELPRRPVGHEGWTELMEAASRGDAAAVQDLLAKQADVNAKDLGGYTALMAAAYGGHLAIVRALLAKGADVNATSVGGETALGSAVDQGHTAIVQALLDHGAAINVKGYGEAGILFAAVTRDREAIVRLLLERGADPNEKGPYGPPLTEAIHKGRQELVTALLDKGADVHARDRNGKSPLLLAVEAGHVPLVGALLGKGADPIMKDSNGDTALILAAGKGHTAIVQMLLAKGADVRAKNNKGLSALSAAAEAGAAPILTTLLEKGADINDRDESGRTALLHAPKGQNDLVVTTLLRRGAEVTAHDLELLLNEDSDWKVETWRALLQRSSSAQKDTWTAIATALIYFQQNQKTCDLKRWDPATQSSAFLLSVPQCPDQVTLSYSSDKMLAISGNTLHQVALGPTARLVASIQRPFERTVAADGTVTNIFLEAGYLRDGRLAVHYERRAPGQGDAKLGDPTIRSLYVFDNNSWVLAEEKPCDDVGECFPLLSSGSSYKGRGYALWSPKLSFNPFVVTRGLAAWDDKKFILDKRVEDVPHKEPQPQWRYVKFNIKGHQSLVIYDAEPGAHSSDLSTYRILLQTAKHRQPVKLAEDQNFTLIEGKYMLVWKRGLRLFDLETGKEPLKGLKFAFWVR